MVPLLHYRHETAVCEWIRVRESGVGEIVVREYVCVCICVGGRMRMCVGEREREKERRIM